MLTDVDSMLMRQLPNAWWPSWHFEEGKETICKCPSLEDESPQMARYRVEHVQPQEQFCNFWINLCISLLSNQALYCS